MIGRADPDQGYWPQLDLSDDGGIEKGVSRRHALVQPTTMDPVLVDQESVNGTWIDDIRLKPGQAYPLPVSGRIRFGKLDVLVYLE
jgi:pSer/pThr/pTyr-binding forkhead associated (FHA) protein